MNSALVCKLHFNNDMLIFTAWFYYSLYLCACLKISKPQINRIVYFNYSQFSIKQFIICSKNVIIRTKAQSSLVISAVVGGNASVNLSLT